MHDRLAYLTLALVPGIGRMRLQALLERFGSAEYALLASLHDLRTTIGMTRAAATAVRAATGAEGERVSEEMERLGGSVLIPEDPTFPGLLRRIPDAPTVLFALGRLPLLHMPAVAVVGSRHHSAYGETTCARFAGAAAGAGVVVVSGMARGLDAVAHNAALRAGGASVGVLGNGLGVVYPAANRTLYDRMAAEGCLLSEYPPGERPHAGSFPRRNRLISGLARATLVVEAARTSGALITAECALRQGREVMAVPGPITSRLSEGTNRLLQAGAKPVLHERDVLEEFGVTPSAPRVSLPSDLTGMEIRLIELLGDGVNHIDELAHRASTDVSEILPAMTSLEIRGLVQLEAGMSYVLTPIAAP